MLLATGRLTLELSQTASSEGFGLKDATPYNVLFRGPQAVFVDLLSFERRDPGDPTWLPYAQFQRMFLLPLLMHQRFGTSLSELFLQQRDGIEPEQVYPYTTWPQRLRAPFLTAVSVPTWLRNRAQKRGPALYRPKQVDPEKAAFILKSQLERLGRQLAKLTKSQSGESTWSSYMQTLSYTDAEFESKTATVTQWVAELRPGSLLDIGCNTGHFSEIAARLGARVVAIDADPAVVGSTWKRATANQLDILPLVVNIARPTPAMGWRNSEYASFLERAAGRFDMVTLLAVIHHLMVTERVPLDEIVSLTAELTTGHAIVEYVSKDDPMFQLLTRGRAALHSNFTQEVFERSCGQRFTVIEKRQSKNGLRCLYLLAKRLS
jgi:SAM-dependent methyltransferase